MAHQHAVPSGQAKRAGAGQRIIQGRRNPLTTLGLLEVLMWGGGASLLLAFWLWPRPVSAPAEAPIVAERSAPAVVAERSAPTVSSKPTAPNPALAQLAEWQERLRSPAQEVAMRDAAGPVSTGSSSPAASIEAMMSTAADAPAVPSHAPDNAGSSAGEDVTSAERTEPDHVEPPRAVEPDIDAPQRADLPDAAQGGTLLAALDPAGRQPVLPEAQVASPPRETTSPDVSASRQEEIASSATELKRETVGSVEPVEVPAQALAKVEATPPVVPAPQVDAVPAPPTAAASAAPTQRPAPAPTLDPAARDALVKRGNDMLGRGDIAAARLFFRRAAEAGDSRGALGMARSFDREVLRKLRVVGISADADQAAHWYARAQALQTVASVR